MKIYKTPTPKWEQEFKCEICGTEGLAEEEDLYLIEDLIFKWSSFARFECPTCETPINAVGYISRFVKDSLPVRTA